MNLDIENITFDKGTEYEETILYWKKRLGRVQLRCPKCDEFFKVPKDIKFDENGYSSGTIYHFCEDDNGWVVTPHIVGYGR